MPKNIEDIITPEKRSIRSIPVPDRRKQPERRAVEVSKPSEPPRIVIPIYKETDAGKKKKRIWIASTIGVLILIFAVLSLMSSSTLAYTPKNSSINFDNEVYSAYKTGGNGVLLFSVVKLSGEKSQTVKASGEGQVSVKATGKAIVYNNAGTAPQKLVATTRFQTPDGKIYRIPTDITIPGKSGSTPGSLEVTLVADQPGDTYNIGLSDFSLPGLKGTSKAALIYARSKTPMTGGFIGVQKTVDPADLATAKESLGNSLKQSLLAEAQTQVPADFVLFPALGTIVYSDLPQSSTTNSSVNINEGGNFYGIIFKRSDLANYLRDKKLPSVEGNVVIPNLDKLNIAFSGNPPADFLKATQINFTLTGPVTLVSVTDENALKKDLAGVNKSDIGTILKNYPSIASAEAILKPFWKTSFPTDSSAITIKKLPINAGQ